MSLALRVLIALFVASSPPLAQAQSGRSSASRTPASQADAKRYETYLKANWQPKGSGRGAAGRRATGCWPPAPIRAPPRAPTPRPWWPTPTMPTPGRASPARCSPSSPTRAAERYDLPVNASGAAWNAYERAQDARRQGRRAVGAARGPEAALLLAPGHRRAEGEPDARRRRRRCARPTTTLVAEHGFRIVEYKVDADSAQPRLCIQFSERLAPGQVDWAQYFKVDGKDPQAVTAEARQICLDGLAHGKRYEVQVRAGLPSAIGEKLPRRPSSPSTCATARRRCAPRAAATCCPTAASRASRSSPSTPTRSTSRSIASATAAWRRRCRAATSAKQISSYDIDTLKERTGAHVYAGELTVAIAPQRGRDHRLPDRRGHPQAAARRLRARRLRRRPRRRTRATASAATQWFVVSDLGLTAHQRRRRRARLRALARRRRRRSSTPSCAWSPATTRCSAPPRPTAAAMPASTPA